MAMAWGGGSSFVPEYVVYQEAVQGAGRASMKHVSWVPTEVGGHTIQRKPSIELLKPTHLH